MKLFSLVRLTLAESFLGQIFWIALIAGCILVGASAFLSGAALAHAPRLLDVSSYFFIDMVCFTVSCFLGAQIFTRNFSPRGLSEIAIPMGFPREGLIAARLLGESAGVIVMAALLYVIRIGAFHLAEVTTPEMYWHGLQMFTFTALKSCLALGAATLLGCLTRPVIAILGTFALFFLGHYSTGVTGLRGLTIEGSPLIGAELNFLFKLFRVWNPNHLILESFDGEWEALAAAQWGNRAGWGCLAFLFFLVLTFACVRNRSIEAREG